MYNSLKQKIAKTKCLSSCTRVTSTTWHQVVLVTSLDPLGFDTLTDCRWFYLMTEKSIFQVCVCVCVFDWFQPFLLNRRLCLRVHLCSHYQCTPATLEAFQLCGISFFHPPPPRLALSLIREKPWGLNWDKSDDMTVLAAIGMVLCD